jgi:hypothetical protein
LATPIQLRTIYTTHVIALDLRLERQNTMSAVKISSDWSRVPEGSSHLRVGQHIRWHYAVFEDLLTENSRMISTSFLSGIEAGVVGSDHPGEGLTRWLPLEALQVKLFLGERSIWIFR